MIYFFRLCTTLLQSAPFQTGVALWWTKFAAPTLITWLKGVSASSDKG